MARAGAASMQLSLDALLAETPPSPPGSLDCATQLCATLSAALKATPLSRFEVAARMSELVGEEITKAQLDAWTAESKERHRFPFEYAAAFEAACGATALQELLGRLRGTRPLAPEDQVDLELGRLHRRELEIQERRRALLAARRARRGLR
jgi:hypothetical protein